MKIMFTGFAVAALLAIGAGFVLNDVFQRTADQRYVTAGATLNHGEAGSNLVGKDWSGMAKPEKH